MDEANRMMEGGSVGYYLDHDKCEIITSRGIRMIFLHTSDGWDDKIRGMLPTPVIMFDSANAAMPEQRMELIRPLMGRNPAIDSKDERVDIATL
jgi:hypothetical protein